MCLPWLENKKITVFPHIKLFCKSKPMLKVTGIPIFLCTCRMPEHGFMFTCTECKKWFHPSCQLINQTRRQISFFLYILPGACFRALSAGVHCTLRVAGWKPTSNHIEITVGFFNLHRGWLSLHRGHPVNVPIRRTMHLSSVIPANDTRESVFGHRNFSRRERESNLGPLAPEASA